MMLDYEHHSNSLPHVEPFPSLFIPYVQDLVKLFYIVLVIPPIIFVRSMVKLLINRDWVLVVVLLGQICLCCQLFNSNSSSSYH